MTDDLKGKELYTVEEVAKMFKMSVNQLRRDLRAEQIEHVKMGPRRTRFTAQQLSQFVESKTIRPKKGGRKPRISATDGLSSPTRQREVK